MDKSIVLSFDIVPKLDNLYYYYVLSSGSQDAGIVAEDKQTEVVRVINSYDTEGNGFINTANLTDLMSALNLVSEPEE